MDVIISRRVLLATSELHFAMYCILRVKGIFKWHNVCLIYIFRIYCLNIENSKCLWNGRKVFLPQCLRISLKRQEDWFPCFPFCSTFCHFISLPAIGQSRFRNGDLSATLQYLSYFWQLLVVSCISRRYRKLANDVTGGIFHWLY